MRAVDRIEAALALAEAQTGLQSSSKLQVCVATGKVKAGRRWTPAEDEFLRTNLGHLTEKEIAQKLRRTPISVHIRRERDLHLIAPSKSPDILTAEHVAMGIGSDSKSVHRLIDRGIMPGRRLPASRSIRIVNRPAFLIWLCKPENWIYFKIDQVGAMRPRGGRGYTGVYDFAFWEDARRLVQNKYRRWKDEWLTPGQISRMLHLPSRSRYINVAIHKGNIKAIKWVNWRILRSALPKNKTLNFKGEWVGLR